MFSYLWHTFFSDPVYNGLIFFIGLVPGGDVGIAIILTTIVIKLILFPLSIKAAKTQKVMREIEPKLREIKEKFKEKREEQAQAMLKVYQEAGMNPFSAIFVIILQIPLVIALYLAVSGSGTPLPEIASERLYSFVTAPDVVTMQFLGLVDMAGRSVLLAVLAGGSMFIQMRFVMTALPPSDPTATPNLQEELKRNIQLYMRYLLPIVVTVVAYSISAAIALYFVVSNVVAIVQEFYVRRHR